MGFNRNVARSSLGRIEEESYLECVVCASSQLGSGCISGTADVANSN